MAETPFTTSLALLTAFGALVAWLIVLIQSVRRWRAGRERRGSSLVMALTATIVSMGVCASALGLASSTMSLGLDREILSIAASAGRGALLTAAILVLVTDERT